MRLSDLSNLHELPLEKGEAFLGFMRLAGCPASDFNHVARRNDLGAMPREWK